jgi:protein TonB
VAHNVSASSVRFDRMSPSALALAVLLHALAALALWWMSVNPPRLPPSENPIDVTLEPPKAPEPPPAPPQKQPPPAPPVELGLRPPAPLTADKPTQVPPKQVPLTPEQPKEARPPPPPAQEQAVAPVQPPQPPPASAPELPKPALPSLPPQAHASLAPPPAKPTPPPQRPELRPSPLATTPQRPPPPVAHAEEPSPSPFVNPADVYNRARVADNYLWQVVAKLSGYHYYARVNVTQGITVVRVVIARDGRLLDVGIARSSGYPAFDNGVIAGVRAGSPYAPLPPEIKGDRATFTLPLISSARQ